MPQEFAIASTADRSDDANAQADEKFLSAFQALVAEIFRFNGLLITVGDQLGRDLDISVSRWQTLGLLSLEEMTAAELSRRAGRTRQAVQQAINRLREQGLVEAIPNPQHKRASLIRLTPDGRTIMAALHERQALLTGWLTESLDLNDEALRLLTEGLRRIRENGQAVTGRELKP